MDVKLPSDEEKSVVERVGYAGFSGYVVGSVLGALTANWSDVPLVLRDQSWPALMRTASVMHKYGVTFAAVGLSFSAGEVLAETLRGKQDWVNGIIGGACAGSALGLRIHRGPAVTAGAIATLCATSAVCDLAGRKFSGHILVDDGATPPPIHSLLDK